MNPGKNIQLACDVASGVTGAQPHVTFQLGPDVSCTVQVDSPGGSSQVDIQGRLDPNAPWVNVPTGGSDIIVNTTSVILALGRAAPEMRVNIDSNASGTRLRVWLMA